MNLKRGRSLHDPLLTVAKIGSGRSPGTLESEKLPFAMLLRCYWLNGSFAALRPLALGNPISAPDQQTPLDG